MESIGKVPDIANHRNENKIQSVETGKLRVYKKRWLILFLYAMYSTSSVIHWIQYSVIADVMVEYYSVSSEAVGWTSMVFSITYIIFSVIGSYVLDKLGLRVAVLIGITGTCIGTWMKVIAVDPSRYWLILLSQGVIAVFQVLVLPVPQKLAAVWFGSKEISLACTMGANSIQFGVALGFIIPPLLVKQGSMETIGDGLLWMSYGIAIGTTMLVFILYFFFEDAPPTPPSLAQLQVQENEKISFDYKKSLLKLVKNRSFMFLLIAFGVHMGTSMAISVLLNQIILSHYPRATEHVGVIGLLITASGIVGASALGVIITKFGRIKLITWIIYISCTISTFLFLFLINQGLIVIYILGVVLSTFWNCIFCVAFGLGAELTYPEPEAASCGLLTNFYQLFGVTLTYVFTYFYNYVSPLAGNLSLVVIILLADSLLFFIQFDLKRSAVDDVKNKSNFVL